jgi:hypothetical protein
MLPVAGALAFLGCPFQLRHPRAPAMLKRFFTPKPPDEPAHTRTVLSYSQFDLAMLSLCAQAIAYYARTGHWPKLAPHDCDGVGVWP